MTLKTTKKDRGDLRRAFPESGCVVQLCDDIDTLLGEVERLRGIAASRREMMDGIISTATIKKCLSTYRTRMTDEAECALGLVDVLSGSDTTIKTGKEELELLADHLADGLWTEIVAALNAAQEKP